MTLDQVFYSAAVDSPSAEGFLPSRLLQCDSQLASVLAEGAVMGGEIAYVRKVDYGRRVLVSLSSAASSEELNMALKTAVDWATGNFSGNVDSKTKQVWQSVEGKLIIIGGSYRITHKPRAREGERRVIGPLWNHLSLGPAQKAQTPTRLQAPVDSGVNSSHDGARRSDEDLEPAPLLRWPRGARPARQPWHRHRYQPHPRVKKAEAGLAVRQQFKNPGRGTG